MQNRLNTYERNEAPERKKQVISKCLDRFIAKGLSETTVRDLGDAAQLKTAGIYWYFGSKDDAVLCCAEEASLRLENNMLAPVVKEVTKPDYMIKRLYSRAKDMAPTMRFLAQVCSTPKYSQGMEDTLCSFTNRCSYYSSKIASKLGCEAGDVEPYLLMGISSFSNYMIFGDQKYISHQVQLIEKALYELNQLRGNA